jgi:AraC-like DNA-binding protein
MRSNTFALEPGWRALLVDMGVEPADVLRRAELPMDLLAQAEPRLDTPTWFRFWHALEAAIDDPCFPIKLAQAVRAESFSPLLFAALCSPDLVVALQRISQYKALVAPVRLAVEWAPEAALTMRFEWLDATRPPPASLIAAELVFMVTLARTATRAHIVPIEVASTTALRPEDAYTEAFGCPVTHAAHPTVRFSPADARRPFLTANESMWRMFEPELRRRLSDLEAHATTAERVRAALLDGLPSGRTSIDDIARTLAVSKRTLQRRLTGEGTRFQAVLQTTREALARHYLRRTTLNPAEIAFLLGFDEPNSFSRAFHDWTGDSPQSWRRQMSASAAMH